MQAASNFNGLPEDIHHEFEDRLDMPSLLALGGTCMYFRDHVSHTLQAERHAILETYWPEPDRLLAFLTAYRAVISGEAALAFLMRDRRLLTDQLEVCVARSYADDLLSFFDTSPTATRAVSDEEWPRTRYHHPTIYVYDTVPGRAIRIMRSHTDSPFTPITTYKTTALFNYFNEFSFGCAYRDLTLNRRAVVPSLPWLDAAELARVDRIATNGLFLQDQWAAAVAFPPRPFTLHNPLAAWPNLGEDDLMNTVCLRALYQCPGQSRFFGDPGSLIDFFAPDMVDHGVMAHWGYPPYGLSVVWRMDDADCDLDCGSGDHVLRDAQSESYLIGQPICYGAFTTGVLRRIRVGDSEHA